MANKLRMDILMVIGLLAAFLGLLKLNAVQGLWGMQFSWAQVVLPLLGALCGVVGSYALLAGCITLRVLGLMLGVSTQLFFGIPTFCASLYWATEQRWIRMGIPVLCMLLFVMHPVGLYAAPYTFYWLIPMGIAYIRYNNSFLTALASTFTAHAVGSVMHLYMINILPASAWLQLMPIVAVERLCLALGMWLVYVGLNWLYSKNSYIRSFQKIVIAH